MNKRYLERVERQLPFLGMGGQKTIYETRLCIVGSGGNGSLTSVATALLGFLNLSVVDGDVMELSNLNRSFLWGHDAQENVGRLKVEITKETAEEIDPSIKTSAVADWTETEAGLQALSKSDAVILCVDRNEPRIIGNGWCAELGIPLLDLGSGGVIRDGVLRAFGWRASLFMPGHACLRCIYLDDEPMPQSQVSYLPLNLGTVAIGLDMLIAYLTGYREVRANHAVYDSLSGQLTEMMVSSRDDCPHCGTRREE